MSLSHQNQTRVGVDILFFCSLFSPIYTTITTKITTPSGEITWCFFPSIIFSILLELLPVFFMLKFIPKIVWGIGRADFCLDWLPTWSCFRAIFRRSRTWQKNNKKKTNKLISFLFPYDFKINNLFPLWFTHVKLLFENWGKWKENFSINSLFCWICWWVWKIYWYPWMKMVGF